MIDLNYAAPLYLELCISKTELWVCMIQEFCPRWCSKQLSTMKANFIPQKYLTTTSNVLTTLQPAIVSMRARFPSFNLVVPMHNTLHTLSIQ